MGQDSAESRVKVEWNVPSLEERFESARSRTEKGSESLAAIFSGDKRWRQNSILDLLAPWEKITTEPAISEKARQVLPLVLMQQRLDYAFVLGRANERACWERACVIHEDQAAKPCAGMGGWAAWVPGGDKLGSSECLDENPVDPQAGASSGAAGGAAASGAASLSAASLSAEGDAEMHDSTLQATYPYGPAEHCAGVACNCTGPRQGWRAAS